MLKSWRCMCTNVCPWPLCRQSQSEKKKIKNCGVLSLKMAQRAQGHMQPLAFLLTEMDQNEILLNKIWVFIRLYWQSKSDRAFTLDIVYPYVSNIQHQYLKAPHYLVLQSPAIANKFCNCATIHFYIVFFPTDGGWVFLIILL